MQFPYVMDGSKFNTCFLQYQWAKLGLWFKQLLIDYFLLSNNVFKTKLEGIGCC